MPAFSSTPPLQFCLSLFAHPNSLTLQVTPVLTTLFPFETRRSPPDTADKGRLPPPPANGGCFLSERRRHQAALSSPISQLCWLLSMEGFVNQAAKCGTHVVHLLNAERSNIVPLCLFNQGFCHRQVWVIKGRVWWKQTLISTNYLQPLSPNIYRSLSELALIAFSFLMTRSKLVVLTIRALVHANRARL